MHFYSIFRSSANVLKIEGRRKLNVKTPHHSAGPEAGPQLIKTATFSSPKFSHFSFLSLILCSSRVRIWVAITHALPASEENFALGGRVRPAGKRCTFLLVITLQPSRVGHSSLVVSLWPQ